MEQLRVGFIGVGGMGSDHVLRFINGEIKNARITAACDIDPDHLYKFKEQLDANVQYFESSDEMIHSGLVDAVFIATPHYDHPLIAKEALKAGLHVFCEKPVGVFTKNVRELNELAAKSGKVFQVNFVLRTLNVYKKIKELIDSGELGTMKRITWIITTWYRGQAYYDSGTWRATWAGEGGGTLLNQNPHNLDLFQWFAGMPKRVKGVCYFGKNRDIEVEDEAYAFFEFENGATGQYITSVSEFPGTNRLEIVGTRGKIVYENEKITFYRTTVSEEQFNKESKTGIGPMPMWQCDVLYKPNGVPEGHTEMINNWVDAIVNGSPLIAPGQEGINSLMISNGIYLSTWNDEWVEFPIDEDAFYEKLQEKIKTSSYVKKEVKKIDVNMSDTFAR